ncbi:MAG: hypothetical protein ACFE95_02125 [Candidatus Hodarchaeota archaeon]
MRIQVTNTFPSSVMKIGFVIIILNNIGWLMVLMLGIFVSGSYIGTPYESSFTPIWFLMTNLCLLSDIIGFFILGMSLMLLKQSTEGSGENQSLLFAGGSFLAWSVLAILWRFLGPLTLGYPIVGSSGTAINLNITDDLLLAMIFLINGIVMFFGTYFLSKMFDTKLLVAYGILNLTGVIAFISPMGNIENQTFISIFFLGAFGFFSKVLLTPCFGILTFTRIWNILRSYLATQ